jgi:hypothetical protein
MKKRMAPDLIPNGKGQKKQQETKWDDKDNDCNNNNFFKNYNSYNKFDRYTTEGLKDELFLQMCFTKETITDNNGKKITVSKYYLQAWELLPRISAGNPPPYFIINLSHLTPKLIYELRNDKYNRDYVVSQAIGRIFENVSPKQYHLSLAKRLRWKFEEN